MKALVILGITIQGLKSKTDKTVVTREFWIETTISLPALPRPGEKMYFNQKDFNLIDDEVNVKSISWWSDKVHNGVMSPVIRLKELDHCYTPEGSDQTIDDEYDYYVKCLGGSIWKLSE